MTGKGSGKRGRPLGFRLSESSKRAIAMSKTGQYHRPETKDKISRSLMLYFRNRNPISEELADHYCNNEKFQEWLEDVGDELDMSMDILTEKVLMNKRKIEIICGHNIEIFSHELTPEVIIMFKQYCEKNNIDPEIAFEGEEE